MIDPKTGQKQNKIASSDLDEVNDNIYEQCGKEFAQVRKLLTKTSTDPAIHDGTNDQRLVKKQSSNIGILTAMNSMKETERREYLSLDSPACELEILASETGEATSSLKGSYVAMQVPALNMNNLAASQRDPKQHQEKRVIIKKSVSSPNKQLQLI